MLYESFRDACYIELYIEAVTKTKQTTRTRRKTERDNGRVSMVRKHVLRAGEREERAEETSIYKGDGVDNTQDRRREWYMICPAMPCKATARQLQGNCKATARDTARRRNSLTSGIDPVEQVQWSKPSFGQSSFGHSLGQRHNLKPCVLACGGDLVHHRGHTCNQFVQHLLLSCHLGGRLWDDEYSEGGVCV